MNRALASLCVLCAGLVSAAAHAAKITEYSIPTAKSYPSALVPGPDGRLWFSESAMSKIAAVTTDGAFTEYPLANQPRGLAVLPGRLLTFAEMSVSGLGFTTVDGLVSELPGFSNPSALVFGPDGRIWICDGSSSLVAFHYLANSPPTSAMALSSAATSVTVGRDGRVWVTEFSAKKVAACSVEGGPCVEYPVGSYPNQIAAAPDGSVWFTEGIANMIGRITAQGALAEFPLPTPASSPAGICAGPDGNVWFTEYDAGKIGRITKDGVVTEYTLPTAVAYPYSITTGPDGNIWFTERGLYANKIGKLQVFVPGDVNDDGVDTVSDVFSLIGYLFAGGPAPK